MTLGVTVLSYALAVVFSLLFEIPYCILSTEILKIQSLKKKMQLTQEQEFNNCSVKKENWAW